ncbi:phosphate acyltransferase PlsX [Paenibacillus lycopersici]|uniref:Phosphate acyltransferase n=1 Tax=Paenibacillus lycopersici TaxID=2704462 RepID=A0A6C0FYN9_9BACL|nr:phosphate acyltransferase PlsX [Paenibacillus lycopersici]QHT60613.1 phosphate acyltransferase PlsX [Paenibacillus lycopersici]
MRIAVDAMGGDHAPSEIVKGALQAALEMPEVTIILVGDTEQIKTHLGANVPSNVEIVHADDVIGPDDEPVKAVRRKKGSSMVMAGQMVRDGQAEAMMSAGNTGALMTTALLVVGRLEGIERPALGTMLPTMDDAGVLALDLGANMDAKPEHLLQYAIMGSIYRARMNGLDKPRVGLLNVGTEAMKGNELTKAAFDLLEAAPIHFIGNVEARDVLVRNCDVLICDGFAGNIMLKAMEGTAGTLFKTLRDIFSNSLITKLAASVLMPKLRVLRKKMDYNEHGGAPLLGINGLVFKCHGSSDVKAVRNTVRQAKLAIQSNLVSSIAAEISRK